MVAHLRQVVDQGQVALGLAGFRSGLADAVAVPGGLVLVVAGVLARPLELHDLFVQPHQLGVEVLARTHQIHNRFSHK